MIRGDFVHGRREESLEGMVCSGFDVRFDRFLFFFLFVAVAMSFSEACFAES